jgi:hypothetical protein
MDDLLCKLQAELGLTVEDILAYADDLTVICRTVGEVSRAIVIIEKWGLEFGMSMNKRKCGILRTGSKSNVTGFKSIAGVPVVRKYRYLGLWLTETISPIFHIAGLRDRLKWVTGKLKIIPIEERTPRLMGNFWQVFVRPLIELASGFEWVCCDSWRETLANLWRVSFRRCLGLGMSVNNEIV